MKNHFIHQYLSQLAQADLRIANQIVFQKAGNHGYDKIRRALANEMFRNFPKAPLAALIWTLRNRKIPSEIDQADILKKISENSRDNVSQEFDDLTINENPDESMDEISPGSEMNSTCKRKQKKDSDNTKSDAKKFKRNNETGMSRNHQVDLSSLSGKKFENLVGNNRRKA